MVSVIYISIQTPDLFKSNSPKMIGDYNFENVKISLLKKGKKQWELTAKKSTIFDNATKFYLVDVNGSYSNKDKNQSIHFSSPTGAYYIDSGVLKLVKTSSRLTYNDSSYFILSDEMELNSEEQMLYAHGNLNINSDKLILTGQKMIGNLNTNQIYLTYDIQGSIFTATD
jgi:LPS export ABC transporter protein LptC